MSPKNHNYQTISSPKPTSNWYDITLLIALPSLTYNFPKAIVPHDSEPTLMKRQRRMGLHTLKKVCKICKQKVLLEQDSKGRSYQFSGSQLNVDLGGVIGNKVQAMAVEVSTFSINEVVPLSPV
ncbi:hypothetical protein CU097_001323, partial [Rhizopus azygosporus]